MGLRHQGNNVSIGIKNEDKNEQNEIMMNQNVKDHEPELKKMIKEKVANFRKGRKNKAKET